MKKQYIYLLILLVSPYMGYAQTVNTGELVVTRGTIMSTVSNFNNTNSGSFINDGELYAYANWHNDGDVDFTFGGRTRFQSQSSQYFTGRAISYFYDVLFENTTNTGYAFNLNTSISVDNRAVFKDGIVKSDDLKGLVIFEENATHSGVYDNSYINGYVQKNGDRSFTFPTGQHQKYRHSAISAPVYSSDVFISKYYFENPIGQTINGETPTTNTAGVIRLINHAEFWTITKESIKGSNVLLTLSWDEDATTPKAIAASPQEAIHIVRWDQSKGLWIDEGGIVDLQNKTVTTPLKLKKYGIFTLARVHSTLVEDGGLVIYNGISPNGDGINDYFFLDGIENLPNNTVQVFNRWGVKVFSTHDYDTRGNVFNGYSDGRITVGGTKLLPTGTYFYVIEYDYKRDGHTQRAKKTGYLYITSD